MNRESKQYTPAEFRDKLKEEADRPKPIIFVGMIKTAEDDQHMMFAQGVTCTHKETGARICSALCFKTYERWWLRKRPQVQTAAPTPHDAEAR